MLQIPEGALHQVEKHGLSLREVEQAFGAKQLVAELRRIGALRVAVEGRQKLLFDASEVAECWARLIRGEFNHLLEGWRGGAA